MQQYPNPNRQFQQSKQQDGTMPPPITNGYYQPAPAAPPRAYYPPMKKIHSPLSGQDMRFLWLFFVAAFLMVDFAFAHGMRLGFTLAYGFVFAVSTVYLWNKKTKKAVFPLLCGGISLAGSLTFALSSDMLINTIMVLLLGGLFVIYALGISGSFRRAQGNFKMLFDVFADVFVHPFENMSDVFGAMKASAAKGKKSVSALLGAFVALPVLIVVIPLLVMSDAAFEGLVQGVTKNFGVYVAEAIAAAVGMFYIYPYMFGKKHQLKLKSGAVQAIDLKKISVVSSVSFLSVIALTYLVYLFSQLAYFFSAFKGLLPDDYAYSASVFARRGFYEMFGVCGINIAVISLVNIFSKKDKSLAIKALSAFISLFSVLLIVIAMQKMNLNIQTYGLSRNRMMVCVFMVMMLVIIAFFIVHIFAPKVSYMQPIIAVCSVMFVAMSFANINAIAARYNVNALQSGKIQNVNYKDCYHVGDYAGEYLIGLTALPEPEKAVKAKVALAYRLLEENNLYTYSPKKKTLKINANRDFRAYCRDTALAQQTIQRYYASLDDAGKEVFHSLYLLAETNEFSYSQNLFVNSEEDKVYCYNPATGLYDIIEDYDWEKDYGELLYRSYSEY